MSLIDGAFFFIIIELVRWARLRNNVIHFKWIKESIRWVEFFFWVLYNSVDASTEVYFNADSR